MLKLSHPLILASGSKVRAEILTALHLPFTVIPSDFDEELARDSIAAKPIPEQALFLSNGKALSVSNNNPNSLILAADQICEADNKILCKPLDASNAKAQLQGLRGKAHLQHSASCLYLAGKCIWQAVETAQLTMRQLTDNEIDTVIKLDKPFNSCGSYMLERHGKHLFTKIIGNDDVIKGLPSITLLNALYDGGYLSLSR